MIAEGIGNAIEVDPRSPTDLVKWVVYDANRYHGGSGFGAQQLWDQAEECTTSWAEKMHAEDWKQNKFGKGIYSHDNMRWAFLVESFGEEMMFKDPTAYEDVAGVIFQARRLRIYDSLREVFKTQMHHQNKTFNIDGFIKTTHAVENGTRNYCSLSQNDRSLLVFALLKYCMPLKAAGDASITSTFWWKDVCSAKEITSLCTLDVDFKPRPVTLLADGSVRKRKADKVVKASSKKARLNSGASQAGGADAGDGHEGVQKMKFFEAVMAMIHEGAHSMDIHNPKLPDLVRDRVHDMICTFANYALFKHITVLDAASGDSGTEMGAAVDVREFVFHTLFQLSQGLGANVVASAAAPAAPAAPAAGTTMAPAGAGGADGSAGRTAGAGGSSVIADAVPEQSAGQVDPQRAQLTQSSAVSFVAWIQSNLPKPLRLQPAFMYAFLEHRLNQADRLTV